jgi:hypothetical protein
MKALLKFRPDLHTSELEDRLVPVSGSGVIVLTPSGYVLTTAFPGATAYPGGSSGGTAMPTSLVMTGFGVSSFQPGSIAGLPGPVATGPSGSSGGAGATIVVGSGANVAGAPVVPVVTRNTIANDALNPITRIGSVSGDRSPVLPAGQAYRAGLPQTAPAPDSGETPEQQSIRVPRGESAGAPTIRLGLTLPRFSSDASGMSSR